jgi:high affinity sulfate transporter 1
MDRSKRNSRWQSVVYMKNEDGFQRRLTMEDNVQVPTYTMEETKRTALSSLNWLFPCISQIKDYNKETFIFDIRSALTVAFVLIPQAIAFSSLAHVEPIRALVSAVFPLIAYSLLGASRQLSVGPEALSSVLVGVTVLKEIEEHGGNPNDIATVLGFLVGIFCVLMAGLRAGFIDNILSGFLLCGFVLGVANLIMIEQMPGMFGLKFEKGEEVSTFNLMVITFRAFANMNVPAAILGCCCLAFLLGFKFFKKFVGPKIPWVKQVPEILVLVLVTTSLSVALDFTAMGIPTLGVFNNSLPTPGFPKVNPEMIMRMLPSIVLITIVGFIESQTVTRAFGLKNGYYPSGDREFFALGSANVFGSFFGSYVTFGSLPRSRIQATSGGKTTLVGAMAAIIVLTLATTLGSVLKFLPKPAMAAIVMNAAINLIEYDEIGFLFSMQNVFEIFLFLITWAMTFFISIDQGIVLCVGLSALLILKKTTMVNLSLLGKISYNSASGSVTKFVDVQEYPEAQLMDGLLAISIQNTLEFYNAGRLRRRIEMLLDMETEMLKNNKRSSTSSFDDLKKKRNTALFVNANFKISDHFLTILLDFTRCEHVDTAATHTLHTIIKNLQKEKARVILSGVKAEIYPILEKGSCHPSSR